MSALLSRRKNTKWRLSEGTPLRGERGEPYLRVPDVGELLRSGRAEDVPHLRGKVVLRHVAPREVPELLVPRVKAPLQRRVLERVARPAIVSCAGARACERERRGERGRRGVRLVGFMAAWVVGSRRGEKGRGGVLRPLSLSP